MTIYLLYIMDGNIFLIKMIQDQPVIWMKNCSSKCGAVKRMHYYEEIAKTIGTNTNWVISRWNMLKNRFFKEYKRKKLKNNYKIKFKYYKNMMFLTNSLRIGTAPDFKTIIYQEKSVFQFTVQSENNMEFMLDDTLLRNWSANNNYFVFNDRKMLNITNISDNCKLVKNVAPPNDNRLTKEILDPDNKKRCEDIIFGELVAAMLKEMPSERKKLIKKQIMNIMLS